MKTLTFTIAGLAFAMLPAVSAPLASKGNSSKDTVQVQTTLSAAGVAQQETNFGNLIADAVRQTGHAQAALVPAADLGYIPIVVADACGAGHAEAAERSVESLKFTGDALFTDTETLCRLFEQAASS